MITQSLMPTTTEQAPQISSVSVTMENSTAKATFLLRRRNMKSTASGKKTRRNVFPYPLLGSTSFCTRNGTLCHSCNPSSMTKKPCKVHAPWQPKFKPRFNVKAWYLSYASSTIVWRMRLCVMGRTWSASRWTLKSVASRKTLECQKRGSRRQTKSAPPSACPRLLSRSKHQGRSRKKSLTLFNPWKPSNTTFRNIAQLLRYTTRRRVTPLRNGSKNPPLPTLFPVTDTCAIQRRTHHPLPLTALTIAPAVRDCPLVGAMRERRSSPHLFPLRDPQRLQHLQSLLRDLFLAKSSFALNQKCSLQTNVRFFTGSISRSWYCC
eukprot:PhF_6_TR37860/c0_g1_i1/m.56402